MLETDSIEPPKEIVKNDLSTLSNNIISCLSAVSLKVGSDKETISCVEECVIATEELQTLGGLVRTDIKAVCDSVTAINEQIEQLESLFRNIDHLEGFVKQKKEQLTLLEYEKSLVETAKDEKELPDFIEIEKDSEDDSPMEISSKVQCKMPVTENISNLKSKKVKKKTKRQKYKVIKLNESIYKSETKTSTFKVVPLSVSPPQPSFNFRAQLLQKRTKNQRLTKMEQAGLKHKNKWFAATRRGCH
ncbi:unnamed protein product [Onchocerca ochengi]|uniref:Exosome complex component RRP46 n=1 Tax=Onchocerca ochengi TaxID=42157 RepID=A0A182ECR7_ONCOC|nr:unnamed protein product [Onchocerca ochengi]